MEEKDKINEEKEEAITRNFNHGLFNICANIIMFTLAFAINGFNNSVLIGFIILGLYITTIALDILIIKSEEKTTMAIVSLFISLPGIIIYTLGIFSAISMS